MTQRLASISHTAMVRTWLARHDMPLSTHIWALNSHVVTILSPWASFSCISTRVACRGRACPHAPRRKSMRRSGTRSYRRRLRHWQRTCPMSSESTWTIVAAWNSRRSQILVTWGNFSKTYSTEWAMNTTSSSTGWSKSHRLSSRCAPRQPRKTTRIRKRATLQADSQLPYRCLAIHPLLTLEALQPTLHRRPDNEVACMRGRSRWRLEIVLVYNFLLERL